MIAAIAAVGANAPGYAAPKEPLKGEVLHIYLVNDQSAVDAIVNQAEQDPVYAAKAAAFAERWRKGLTAGKNPRLPGLENASTTKALLVVEDLKSQLADVAADPSPIETQSAVGVTTIKTVATASAVDQNNANTYPLRGAKDSSGLYWKMTLTGTGVTCNDECEVTDKYVANLTINPGTNSTRINGSNLYFPNHGGFTNRILQISAVCNGTICGRRTTGTLPASSSDVISGYGDRHSKVLTIGVALLLYHGGSYVMDAGKTHDCTGQAASAGNNCKYSS